MNTISLKNRIVGVLAVTVLGIPIAVTAQSSSEKEESSGKASDRGTHELGHVLQQKKPPRSPPGERVMRPTYGAGQNEDPDRPVITGRVPNHRAGDGSIPTETLSLNFEKVRLSSVRVSERLRHKNRAIYLGRDNRIYLVPDGIYGSKTKGEIEIKGSKIKENAASTEGSHTVPSQNRVITMAPSAEDGRYTGPGGAWVEIKGGRIVSIGGQLQRHKPPPFYDVTADGGLRIRNK